MIPFVFLATRDLFEMIWHITLGGAMAFGMLIIWGAAAGLRSN